MTTYIATLYKLNAFIDENEYHPERKTFGMYERWLRSESRYQRSPETAIEKRLVKQILNKLGKGAA